MPPPTPNNLHKYAVLLITKVCHLKKICVPPQSVKKLFVPPQSVIASYGPVFRCILRLIRAMKKQNARRIKEWDIRTKNSSRLFDSFG